ncbi:NAD(P)/FAD-dependent oxidoreductase [Verrucomicrobiota bacterium sgz303538]
MTTHAPQVTHSDELRSGEEPCVVIVGGGFAGLNAAKRLAGKAVSVKLIDRNNYHLFQPLLYQVATGTLSPANIAQPLRSVLRRAENIQVLMDTVERIDLAARKVIGRDMEVSYDYLIVATGARHSYFGRNEWEPRAPGLKDLPDALELRRRIFSAFEEAEKMAECPERHAALTFVIVGAGPTGLEMAGAIAEIARYTLRNNFRRINPRDARILLLDAAPRVLPTFDPELSEKAKAQVEGMGIEVQLNAKVENVTEQGVQVGDQFIPSHTVIWAAGNEASPLGRKSGLEVDRAGRVIVNPDLTLPGHPEVQVLGDCSNFSHQGGKPLPGVAPVAIQQGQHAAENILAAISGEPLQPFHYHDKGSMATIGRRAGVADIGGFRFGGLLAWLAWLLVHLIFLIGFRNRIFVLFEWAWAYFTFARDVRLITGNTADKQQHIIQEAGA